MKCCHQQILHNENSIDKISEYIYNNPKNWTEDELLKPREAPYFIDDKKLESYQLDSRVSDYESNSLSEFSDFSGNNAGEITGGMYEGDWDDIKETLGYQNNKNGSFPRLSGTFAAHTMPS